MKHTHTKFSRFSYMVNLVVVGVLLVAIMRVVLMLLADGLFPLASALSAITVFLAMIYLRRRFTPLRWLAIGIALALMFTLYPILYTFYLSVTNMGPGHLISKQQAIDRIEEQTYMVAEGQTYAWTAFVDKNGQYVLWLMPDEGPGFAARQTLRAVAPGENGVGELDENGIPLSIEL
jgi:hypothetical protein